ncbi:hypothetical protein GQX73_g1121 [Xylaria multiplex]|uniref:Zn(2)-C6 fungal-type domain-containing protein n=1 Tax=Xylaria multiplex TaxID=323545 RepID=A0A7C8J0Y1_9PEZI|nr:hypothetical protein GQX73_g1121 [Xylaria multiplex]
MIELSEIYTDKASQCDEQRPQCVKCVLFGVRCTFLGDDANSASSAPDPLLITPDHQPSGPRGRGRPRKAWTIDAGTPTCENITSPSASSSSEPTKHSYKQGSLNIDEAELLLHFTQVTAYSLAGNIDIDDPFVRFWTYNLPRIGLTHHFVLRLAYAVAAYHIAYCDNDISRKRKYRDIAEHHASLGLRQLTPVLASIDKDNCGAAYIAATLVCYCTFSAGPVGPGDLLVCNLETTHDAGWLPLIYGVRLIREKFAEDVLFAGLMEPFMGKKSEADAETLPKEDRRARCHREGFKRLDWEEPLKELRDFVASQTPECADICIRELDGMILIYEGTFGHKDATFDRSFQNQFVFGWLYRMNKSFVGLLRQKNPSALVMLAYYAVLLRTERLWCIKAGWAEHLLLTVRGLLEEDYTKWLYWPAISLQESM